LPGKLAARTSTESPKIKEYRTLGRTGFKVSDISIGTGGSFFDPSIINKLLDAGVNYIDTTESYGGGRAEKTVGEVLKKHDRKSIFITSKLGYPSKDTKDRQNEKMPRATADGLCLKAEKNTLWQSTPAYPLPKRIAAWIARGTARMRALMASPSNPC
jgi:hypothetical protein